MNVGIGSTVLEVGRLSGHLDGIAVYTKHLLEELPSPNLSIKRFAFIEKQHDKNIIALGGFTTQAAMSAVTGLPFPSSKYIPKDIDLFHATDHQVPKLRNIPVVATIMDPIPLAHPEWVRGRYRGIKNIFFRRMAQWADHIITISDYSAQAIEEHFHIPSSRISVIPLGVDKQCFKIISEQKKLDVLSRYNLPKNYFVFIGTLQPRKNVERLLQAFLQLPEDIQRLHPLVIIGRHGWKCESLIKQLNQLKMSKKVHWLDYVPFDDKYALLQSSLAMVFPSLYEGFGLPILEAFASDIPVIASNITSLPEVTADAAILIDPYSEEELSYAMLSIAQSKILQQNLIQKGRARVDLFSWENTAKKTIDVYQSII